MRKDVPSEGNSKLTVSFTLLLNKQGLEFKLLPNKNKKL